MTHISHHLHIIGTHSASYAASPADHDTIRARILSAARHIAARDWMAAEAALSECRPCIDRFQSFGTRPWFAIRASLAALHSAMQELHAAEAEAEADNVFPIPVRPRPKLRLVWSVGV
jgi:hypothetical protein